MFFKRNPLRHLKQLVRNDTVTAVQLKDGSIHYFDAPVSLATAAAMRSNSSSIDLAADTPAAIRYRDSIDDKQF